MKTRNAVAIVTGASSVKAVMEAADGPAVVTEVVLKAASAANPNP